MRPFTRRTFLWAGLGTGAALTAGELARHRDTGADSASRVRAGVAGPRPDDARPSVARRQAAALGSTVVITVHHHDSVAAHRAIDAALAALDQVEDVLSLYRPHSQVSRLNRDGVLDDPHADFSAVLTAALYMSQRTRGAFDCTIQPLWQVHELARKQGRTADAQAIAAARQRVDWKQIHVGARHVTFGQPGMAVTFNGIAQGFATDRVKQELASHGITQAMIDVGELAALGRHGDKPWQVGVQHPREEDAFIALAALDDRCLATSGDYESSFGEGPNDAGAVDDATAAGTSGDQARSLAHHILDPATGQSPRELCSVTIAARTAMQADALSTAAFVMGAEKGSQLVRSLPGADGLFVFADGRMMMTPGFPRVG